jgi:hypothetical protein
MSTGRFNNELKVFFGAKEGAFTVMTEAEVGKSTFNIKKEIKNLLIQNLGETTVQGFNSTTNLAMFNVSPNLSLLKTGQLKLVCKYSKPAPKKEMTIYFTEKNGIPKSALKKGYIWFIYFIDGNNTPWLGIMTPTEWNNALSNFTTIDVPPSAAPASTSAAENDFLEDEREMEDGIVPEYTFEIDDMNIKESPPPQGINAPVRRIAKKNVLNKKVKNQEEAKQIKGKKGEEIALEIERRRMKEHNRDDLIGKINWVAKTTDGHGYDIASFDFDDNGNEFEIFIEVKATSGGIKTPFNISLNEVEVSTEKGDSYRIYRIYNLNKEGVNMGYYVVKGAVENNFTLYPVDFKAYKKD